MSTHPNVILKLALTPDDLSRKTMRAILVEMGLPEDHDDEVTIGSEKYNAIIMEDTYNENWQVYGKAGDLLFIDLVTYGYGEDITWQKLEAQKNELNDWAVGICERHHCSFSISVTANYW